MRFMALAIFLTGDLLRECAFSSRTSAFDQERRLARLPCLFAITYLLRHNWGTDNGGAWASRVELVASSLSDLEVLQADFSSKAADHWVFGPTCGCSIANAPLLLWSACTTARQRPLEWQNRCST